MMKKRLLKKHHLYILIPLLFFIITFFLFYNVSETLYYNIIIIIARERTSIIVDKVESGQSLQDVINATIPVPPALSGSITDDTGNVLDSFGTRIDTMAQPETYIGSGPVIVRISDRSKALLWKTTVNNNTLTVLYDFDAAAETLFSQRGKLVLLIFLFNALIFFFLAMIIFSYQRKINIKDNELKSTQSTDRVTGLSTRNWFFKQMHTELERFMRNGSHFTLLLADIDQFRDFHQKYAWEFGDMVLRTVGSIFKANFRRFDIIGKVGDDEIAVVMIDSSVDDGINAAKRCITSIRENKFYFEKDEITISLSFGISSTRESIKTEGIPARSIETWSREILFDTLNALSRAKREGGNALATSTDIIENLQKKNSSQSKT
jgi:diguanylate cyclase (GGDEF)-like protein